MKLLYFHGYGSNRASRKYILSQAFFSTYEAECIEWTPDTDFKHLLQEVYTATEQEENIVLIGDSTGANFAYQLKEMRKKQKKKTLLLLLSPLLSYTHRLNKELVFTDNLKNSLIHIPAPADAWVLLGKQDETLDLRVVQPYDCINTEILYVNDSHRLPLFDQYLEDMKAYINRQVLISTK